MEILLIIWVIGVISSISVAFVLQNRFTNKKEAAIYVLKISFVSLFLSWIIFILQMAMIIAIWTRYHGD